LMRTETVQLAVYVLRWLDRNALGDTYLKELGDTYLREVMDLVANYDCSLERAIQVADEIHENTKKAMEMTE